MRLVQTLAVPALVTALIHPRWNLSSQMGRLLRYHHISFRFDSLELRVVGWTEAECGCTTQKLGGNGSCRVLQEMEESTKLRDRDLSCWSLLCHGELTVASLHFPFPTFKTT